VEESGGDDDEEVSIPFPDLIEVGRFFEAGGVRKNLNFKT